MRLSPRPGTVLRFLAVGLGCYGTAILSRFLTTFRPFNALPAWLPSGVALGCLLWLGMRYWPAIMAAIVLSTWQEGSGLSMSLVSAGATALGAIVPAVVLRRVPGFSDRLDRFQDAVWFLVVAALIGPLVGASLNMVAIYQDPSFQAAGPYLLWYAWFRANLAGVLLVAPAILAWRPGAGGRIPASLPELAALVLLTAGAFFSARSATIHWLLFFPLVAWAATRTGLRGATAVTLVGFFSVLTGTATSSREALPELTLVAILVLAQSSTGLLLAGSTSERQRTHAERRRMEEAYRALIAASPMAITGLNPRGQVIVWSRAAERLFGWPEAEAAGRSLSMVFGASGVDARRLLEQVVGGAVVSERETQLQARDGRRVDVSLQAWPLYDTEGRQAGTMVAALDITERKTTERLQHAIYRIGQAAQTAGSLGSLFQAIHGIVEELMPARNFQVGLIDPADGAFAYPYWVDERLAGPPRQTERGLIGYVARADTAVRGSGEGLTDLVARGEVDPMPEVPADWMAVPLRNDRRVIGVLAVQTYDPGVRYSTRQLAVLEFVASQVAVTVERWRAEAALRASEAEFRALFAAMRDLILVVDREGRCLRVGPTSPDLQRPPGELVGRLLTEVFPPRTATTILESVQRALQRQIPVAFEYALTQDGERWFHAMASPLADRGAMVVARDVTEQRQAEQALRQSEAQLRHAVKMEAVGRLAGGVAHDFNNLLTAILGHADLVLARLRPDDPLSEDLREIKEAGIRASGLTRQLLAFSRKQVLEPETLDLNLVVTGLVRILRRTIGADVELVTRLAPDLGLIRADPSQLEQVLLNLAVNARDAMPEGGRLTIETRNIETEGQAGVQLSMTDTGVGMSPDVLAHVFEPFFTTKEQGKGTGLGLATVYGIVEQSGGRITVSSETGRGTTFLVDLPRVEGEARGAVAIRSESARPGWETILLVEDDAAVRALTRRVLEEQGYRVLAAADGESGIALSRGSPDPLHLLLTDVVMQGLGGARLAEQLAIERPGLRVIFMSGYAPGTLEERIQERNGVIFLQKPFAPELLLRRVQQVLDTARP